MKLFDKALVIDGSVVACEVLAHYLTRVSKASESVQSLEEARAWLAGDHASLVVLDATLPGAFDWFECCSAQPERPMVLVVTTRPSFEEEVRATLLGAVGYLPKPISSGELVHAIRGARGEFLPSASRAYAASLAVASIDDPDTGESQLACQVIDLSEGGALLATGAPGRVGREVSLRLAMAGRVVAVGARIARVQEPDWDAVAGWGVRFEYPDEQTRSTVAEFVAMLRSNRQHAEAWPSSRAVRSALRGEPSRS